MDSFTAKGDVAHTLDENTYTDDDEDSVINKSTASSSFFRRVSGLRDLEPTSADVSENENDSENDSENDGDDSENDGENGNDNEIESINLDLDQLSIIPSPSLIESKTDVNAKQVSETMITEIETRPGVTMIDSKTTIEDTEIIPDAINKLKPSYAQILADPTFSLEHLVIPTIPHEDEDEEGKISSGAREKVRSEVNKILRFKEVLSEANIDLDRLKQLAWLGIPAGVRSMSWQLLLGYLPTNSERRRSTLARKRQEYQDGVRQTFSKPLDPIMWHQILIDIPRTSPGIQLFAYPATQRAMERILYLWAIRHPASGYVQGINDLVTPLFMTFLADYVDTDDITLYDPANLPSRVLDTIEADTLWCLTKLLDGIQDNYIHAQPGIHRQVHDLQQLTARIDSDLAKHLKNQQVEFMQFSFRWMNCLLMRELTLDNVIRMWDTYMAEDGSKGFSQFHVYVCAAFLVKWSSRLMTMDFAEIMMFLQNLPTQDWQHSDIELLLSEAFMWQSLFENAIAHLN